MPLHHPNRDAFSKHGSEQDDAYRERLRPQVARDAVELNRRQVVDQQQALAWEVGHDHVAVGANPRLVADGPEQSNMARTLGRRSPTQALGAGSHSAHLKMFGLSQTTAQVQVQDGSPALAAQKSLLMQALNEARATETERNLLLAMALRASPTLEQVPVGAARADAPVSPFAVSVALLRHLGFAGDVAGLRSNRVLSKVAGMLLQGLRAPGWGVQRLLNFQANGSQGFADGSSAACCLYRDQIAALYMQLQRDPSLRQDGRLLRLSKPPI